MALKSWLVSLKRDVSSVSGVQAPIHAGLGRYVTDTLGKNQTYQAKPNIHAGCTGDTADTCKKINADIQTTEAAPTSTQAGPKRLFRQRGPWLTCGEHIAARAYHAHHFNCHTCIAAGRGIRYGRRCTVGLALWHRYTGADDLQTEGGNHGQA